MKGRRITSYRIKANLCGDTLQEANELLIKVMNEMKGDVLLTYLSVYSELSKNKGVTYIIHGICDYGDEFTKTDVFKLMDAHGFIEPHYCD